MSNSPKANSGRSFATIVVLGGEPTRHFHDVSSAEQVATLLTGWVLGLPEGDLLDLDLRLSFTSKDGEGVTYSAREVSA